MSLEQKKEAEEEEEEEAKNVSMKKHYAIKNQTLSPIS